jgi:hypothetical protein
MVMKTMLYFGNYYLIQGKRKMTDGIVINAIFEVFVPKWQNSFFQNGERFIKFKHLNNGM